MRVYLSGPMSGLPEFNYPAFKAAALQLERFGFEVVNPAENGLPKEAAWEQHMRLDIQLMLDCDGLVMLSGWENSKGARIERRLAMELGLPVGDLETVLAFQCRPKFPGLGI